MLSFLSALLSIVSAVMKYLDRQSVEEAGRAKEIIASWARNDAIVMEALNAGKVVADRLDANPDSVFAPDKNQRD